MSIHAGKKGGSDRRLVSCHRGLFFQTNIIRVIPTIFLTVTEERYKYG